MMTMLEILEDRIAPAVLVNPTTVVYTDVDGDTVTIKVSKGDLAGRFSVTDIMNGITDAEQLDRLDLNDQTFQGANVTITAKPSSLGGDGFANVGFINAEGAALGKVKIDGDLGKILAGNLNSKVGLKSLEVQSMGVYGTSTGAPDLITEVKGSLTTLKSKGDLARVEIKVVNNGSISTVDVKGSLIGGAMTGEGSIHAQGEIKKVTLSESLIGGGAAWTGYLSAGQDIGTVSIGRNIEGGTGGQSGGLQYAKKITVGGDVTGGATGTGQISGQTIEIKGSLIGGTGNESGTVFVADGGTVKIGRDVEGGSGVFSGSLMTSGNDVVKSITIGGDLVGGTAAFAGSVRVHEVKGALTIKGDMKAGTGLWAGAVHATTLGKVAVDGSIVGASDFLSNPTAGIYAENVIKEVSIKGSIEGAYGRTFIVAAGEIAATTLAIGKVTIGSNAANLDILAGYSINSATGAYTGTNGDASIGTVKVGGNWTKGNITAGVRTSDVSLGFHPDVTSIIAGSSTSLTSSIASIVIGGQAAGAPGAIFNYAFVAQQPDGVPSFKIAKKTFEFVSVNDVLPIGSTFYSVTQDFNFWAFMKA